MAGVMGIDVNRRSRWRSSTRCLAGVAGSFRSLSATQPSGSSFRFGPERVHRSRAGRDRNVRAPVLGGLIPAPQCDQRRYISAAWT